MADTNAEPSLDPAAGSNSEPAAETKSIPANLSLADLRFFLQMWYLLFKSATPWTLPKAASEIEKKQSTGCRPEEMRKNSRKHPNIAEKVNEIQAKLGKQFILPEIKSKTEVKGKQNSKERSEVKSNKYFVDPSDLPRIETIRKLLETIDSWGRRDLRECRLRLGVGHSVSLALAPRIIRSLRAEFPDVDVTCVVDDYNALEDLLDAKQIDVILTVFPPDGIPYAKAGRNYTKLTPSLIAGIAHPVAREFRRRSSAVSIGDILHAVKPEKGDRHVIHFFEQASIRDPQGVLKSHGCKDEDVRYLPQANYAAINEFVTGGFDLGVTLPQFLMEHQAQSVQIIPLAIPDENQPALAFIRESDETQLNWVESQMSGFREALDRFERIARKEIARVHDQFKRDSKSLRFRIYAQFPCSFGDPKWYSGMLWIHRNSDGRFAGELELTHEWYERDWTELRNSECIRLTVTGCEITDPHSDQKLVMLSGSTDNLVFSACFSQRQFSDIGPILGKWMGGQIGNHTIVDYQFAVTQLDVTLSIHDLNQLSAKPVGEPKENGGRSEGPTAADV